MCVYVCVCERERERARERIAIKRWEKRHTELVKMMKKK